MLRFGSLFSGIGGCDLGLERAGMKAVWQVEIDEYASRVLQKHWPEVARFTDVRDCGASNLEPVDLIVGGFPCQDISNAGRRVGIEGHRSGLWGEFARIIRELRPRFVIVENVAALLARGLERVLGDLAACGYDAEWDCLPASAFGAPHRRDRVFLVAYPNGNQLREQSGRSGGESWKASPLSISDGQERPLAYADGKRVREKLARRISSGGQDTADASRELRDGPRIFGPSWRVKLTDCRRWPIEPDVGRVVDGFPGRLDRLKGLGNAVVPKVIEFIGRQILEYDQSD